MPRPRLVSCARWRSAASSPRPAAHNSSRRRFSGDASSRRYETVEDRMVRRWWSWTPRASRTARRSSDGLPYSRIAHLAEDVAPFVAIANALSARGFAAPAIHRADLDAGLLLIDHLGAGPCSTRGPSDRRTLRGGGAALAALHQTRWEPVMPVADGMSHTVPPYDRRAMRMEVDLLPDWYLPMPGIGSASPDETGAVRAGLGRPLRCAGRCRDQPGAARFPFAQHHLAPGGSGACAGSGSSTSRMR